MARYEFNAFLSVYAPNARKAQHIAESVVDLLDSRVRLPRT